MVLTLLFAAISGLLTGWFWTNGMSAWWVLPAWIGLFVGCLMVYLILLFSAILLIPKGNPSPRIRGVFHRQVRVLLRFVLVLLGIRVKLVGADKLPDSPYLLVSNHRSAFEPLCTLTSLTADTVFVVKPAVLKIPVIGPLMERLCFLAIDRENARNAVSTIKRAAELIRDVGFCVGIYPEGTRSKSENLHPFHAGSFKIAKLANCPVVVMSVRLKKRWILPPSCIELRVVDVMDVAYVADSNTAAMTARAESIIRSDLAL